MNAVVVYHFTKKEGQWIVRIDKAHGSKEYHQRHVHIYRKGLKGEYSWNVDGTRHDQRRFPVNEKQINRARELAATALGVRKESLQFLTSISGGWRVTISFTGADEQTRTIASFYVRVREDLFLFGANSGLTAWILAEY